MPYDIILGRNESDKKAFGKRGLIYLGKSYVKMGQYTSLSNKIFMDVARSHVILVSGKRGSGKSYTLGVIAEELANLPEGINNNIAPIIFDTMGIYWTMKFKNEKDKVLLNEWGEQPKSLPIKVFVPFGHYDKYLEKGIPIDEKFALSISELTMEDWILTFKLDITHPIAILIERTITKLKKQGNYNITDIISSLEKDEKSDNQTKNAATGLFEAADTWGVFERENQEPTKIKDLINAGTTTVLDLSVYNSVGAFNVRALVISLVSRKIFNQRMDERKKEEIAAISKGLDYFSEQEQKENPLVWIFIDECLTGDTKIKTDKGELELKKIIKNFPKEKYKVLSYDQKEKNFKYCDIKKTYKKGKRKIIKITTETGRQIKCTPEHRVLTKQGVFASAFSVNNLAFPLKYNYSKNKKIIEARILGHLFGDGWITDKQQSIGFSGKGNKKDLEKIRKDLKELGFSSTNIYERKTSSQVNHKGKIIKIKGTSQSFTSNRPAYRYFRKKAGFSGTKSLHPTKIPKWLIKASNEEKAEFLSALMGSDGQIISQAKNAKGDFNAIRFSFNKLESLEKEAFEFAYQIKFLFNSLGIQISNISKKEGNLKKDGNKTIKIVITLKKNLENTIKFLEKVGYRYCSKKEVQGLKYLEYLMARIFLKKQREAIYKKAIRLHKKKGYGKTKISKLLNFPEFQIRDWIYMGNQPGLPKKFSDFKEWIKKREKENILYENIFKIKEIKEEEVYDLSVDKTHNFISNNFITHNCHEFLPKEGKTIATDALVQILREGRQPGISLVLATQQPGQIHRDVMTQSDVIISHRVTSQADLEALNFIMQSYLLTGIKQHLDDLPTLKGSAIILDDNSERIYPMRVKPRFTWHGGEAPTAIKAEKKL